MDETIKKLSDELIVKLPPDLLAQLGWEAGDVVIASIHEGGIKFMRKRSAHDHAMDIARRGMDKYHDAFVTLAKS
jgi:antitoxin component of MazEF toxin-antitoxin module